MTAGLGCDIPEVYWFPSDVESVAPVHVSGHGGPIPELHDRSG